MITSTARIAACGTAVLSLLVGCGTVNTQVKSDIAKVEKAAREKVADKPLRTASISRVTEIRGKLMPVTPVTGGATAEWLKQTKVTLDIKNPTPLSAVVAKLAEQGLNIVCDLPLDSYNYVGRINQTDAEAALQSILGSSGLDFQTDDARKLVLIKPMSSKTWSITIGNRKATYSSDSSQSSQNPSNSTNSNNSMGGGTSNSTQGGTGGGSQTTNSTMPSMAGGASGSTGSNPGQQASSSYGGSSSGGSSSGTGVTATDDFWTSLAQELKQRLTVLVPKSIVRVQAGMAGNGRQFDGNVPPPIMSVPQSSGGPGSSSDLYVPRLVGAYSLNPETGAVTVQAPHWILRDLDSYFKTVLEMYNTDITFEGEIVLVTSTRTDSEGLDVSAFGRWANGKYGVGVSNNALGGVTVSTPAGAGAILTAGNQTVGGALIGASYRGATTALDIFNAYLSEMGQLSVIESPLVTTVHGVPGIFSTKEITYYNTVSQQAASGGTGSAATATQNVLVPVEMGTELRINPRIDVATGLIRAQLTLNQTMKSGSVTVPQTITTGNTSQTVNTTIPLLKKQNVQGEILVRDGDLIVVGGQTANNLSIDDNGLPSQEGPLGGILGVKKATKAKQTYYFALRVAVNRRQ